VRRQDNVAQPARPRRGLSWLGAFVLLVLVATAGLPAGHERSGAATRVEATEGASVAHRRAAADHRHAPAGASGPVADVPRPLPRTRQVQSRGLPPARAPTC